jgi:CheY-like chemotaxis protein
MTPPQVLPHDIESALVRLQGFISIVEADARAQLTDPQGLIDSAQSAVKTLRLACAPALNQVPLQHLTQSIDAILLDDDSLMGQTWSYAAHLAGRNLRVFDSPQALFAITPTLAQDVSIFIDLNLGHELSGLEVCERLFAQGFRDLHLATGANPTKTPAWLKITGKNPPF